MAVTDQQKLDFLLKKIGYTKTKTGSVVGTGAISGTPKQPFAEAIPSPLVVANASLWNEADSIPATPPGADTTQVKVYLAGTSGLRMTADATSSGQRAYIAYTTYGNTSSARLTNWIDTQFGASYIIKVYKGDPNSGGVALSAAGSGSNDGWFFDYSAGVLNFNDTSVPSGVTDTNIYIVGYRYIGQTGAPTSGISTFSYLDLTVERNLDVGIQGGISTFRNNIDLNANLDVSGSSTFTGNIDANGDLDVDGHTNLDNVSIAGVTTTTEHIHIDADNKKLQIGDGQDLQLWHNGTDSFIKHTPASGGLYMGGKIVSLNNQAANRFGVAFFENVGDARLYWAGTDYGVRLKTTQVGIDIPLDLDVDGHTNLDNVSIAGFTTITQDLDVDGHTNLDNISVAGVSTFTGDATFAGNVSIGGTLTYEDVVNVDAVGLITARSGIRVTGGVIEALAGENKIPSLYANMGALPAAGSYHGMFAHVHSTGRGYFAHAGNWLELVNKEINGVVGTGTERYNVGPIDAVDINVSSSSTTKSLNVTGVTTVVTLDVNGDIDVDGHTNLDNVSVAGVTTFSDRVRVLDNQELQLGSAGDLKIKHDSASPNNSSIVNHTGFFRIANFASGQTMFIDAHTHQFRDQQSHTKAKFNENSSVELYHDGNFKFETTSSGVNVSGTTTTTGLAVSGVSTFTGAIDANGDLDVDGHTNLDNVSVAGVTTFSGITDFDNIFRVGDVGGFPGSTQSSRITKKDNHPAGLTFDHGSSPTLEIGSKSGEVVIGSNSYGNSPINFKTGVTLGTLSGGTTQMQVTPTGVNITKDLDVDGHTELDNVNIVGVTTAAGHILPATDSTYDLGSSSKQWRNFYVSNIVTAPGGPGFFGPDLTVRNLKSTGISTLVTTDINGDLDVDGHTNLDNVSVAGVTTFTGTAEFDGTAKFDSTITAGGATGSNGQYLKTTGTGVEWASFPTMRTRDTITASAGQTAFTFSYTVNFLDVFVNGIKLTDAEFTATNGSSVVLAVGCFVGDIVELVSYNTVSGGGGGGGGSLNNIVEDTSPQLGGNLDLFNKTINGTGSINMTGVVTATSFIGNGSGLTGVVASGSGVVVKNSGSTVGTAGTIDFGNNLSVSPASAGIVTITGSSNFNNLSVSGIATFSGYVNTGTGATVGIGSTAYVHKIAFAEAGSTNSTLTAALGNNGSALTFTGGSVQNGHWDNAGLKIAGNGASALTGPEANCSLHVVSSENTRVLIHGAATAQMELRSTVGNGVENIFKSNKALDFITGTGAYSNVFRVGETEGSTFFHTLNFRASDAASKTVTIDAISGIGTFKGIVVNGATSTISNLNITGVVTATTFKGALEATSASFSSHIDANGDLDVDGHTNLDNVSVAGVTTFASNVSVGSSIAVGTGVTIESNGQATYTGIVTAQKFVGDGSSLTGISGGVTFPGGTANTVAGTNAGDAIVSGASHNTLFGHNAGQDINTGDYNTFVGSRSGFNATTGLHNTGVGYNVMGNHGGWGGAALGRDAGNGMGGSNYSIAIGFGAYSNISANGDNNIVIGYQANVSSSSASNEITFGNDDITHFRIPGIGVSFSEGGAVVSGVVTATSFVGDGSALTGISGSGGVTVQDEGSALSTQASTLNFVGSGVVASGSGATKTITISGGGGGSGISTISGVVNIANDLDVDGHTNLDNVSISGVSTVAGNCSFAGGNVTMTASGSPNSLNVSGTSRFEIASMENALLDGEIAHTGDTNTLIKFPSNDNISFDTGGTTRLNINNSGATVTGTLAATAITGDGSGLTGVSPAIGITTNLSGSFTASAGSPSTLNSFGYGSGDIVVEYTVFIKNGSDFQSQKLLAMRDGTTIHSTQFAVMYSSSLLVQCDATISSGNILLRATPETGVSGSTTYKVKREVM